jgi:hypothetical protein
MHIQIHSCIHVYTYINLYNLGMVDIKDLRPAFLRLLPAFKDETDLLYMYIYICVYNSCIHVYVNTYINLYNLGMVDIKDLRPAFLRLLPAFKDETDRLPAIRAALQREVLLQYLDCFIVGLLLLNL